MTAKLRYFGTEEDVRLGDRVEYTSWLLRRKRLGTVVCIPAKTAIERREEKMGPENWLIELDDGTFTGWMYHPEEIQPGKRLRLISRGARFDPITNEELDRRDDEIARSSGPLESLAGCGVVIAIVIALWLALRWLLN